MMIDYVGNQHTGTAIGINETTGYTTQVGGRACVALHILAPELHVLAPELGLACVYDKYEHWRVSAPELRVLALKLLDSIPNLIC